MQFRERTKIRLRKLQDLASPELLIARYKNEVDYKINHIAVSFTKAPIALVTALRETSIVFALLIGVFFLKERLDLVKVLSTMTTLVGVAILRLAR